MPRVIRAIGHGGNQWVAGWRLLYPMDCWCWSGWAAWRWRRWSWDSKEVRVWGKSIPSEGRASEGPEVAVWLARLRSIWAASVEPSEWEERRNRRGGVGCETNCMGPRGLWWGLELFLGVKGFQRKSGMIFKGSLWLLSCNFQESWWLFLQF